jgi:hypothetical protein
MDYGRVVKVTTGGQSVLYIVAEQDNRKATAIIAAKIEPGSQFETLGRASPELLSALALSPGQFRKA